MSEARRTALRTHVASAYQDMPYFDRLFAGSADQVFLRKLVKRHYAEIRAFIDLKLPLRLALCPFEAVEAKRYFHHLYVEEQGDFEDGKDHATMFLPVCRHFGIDRHELEEEVRAYTDEVRRRLPTEPSRAALISELATSFAWENFTVGAGRALVATLRDIYHLPAHALDYFIAHHAIDQGHSDHALETLLLYVADDDDLARAKQAIRATLVDDLYFLWSLQ
jgi:pyrroloquinoline quinone (PQQ) biosynthesis protein C